MELFSYTMNCKAICKQAGFSEYIYIILTINNNKIQIIVINTMIIENIDKYFEQISSVTYVQTEAQNSIIALLEETINPW